MNLTTAIKTVFPLKDDPWTGGSHGPVWFVEGLFIDDSTWSIGAKSRGRAESVAQELTELVGPEHVFEVEDTGKTFHDKKKWKLKAYPGKPAYGSGGGSYSGGGSSKPEAQVTTARQGNWQPRYRDSEQGAREEGDRIARSVALQQAVVFVGHDVDKAQIVLQNADLFYEWLTAHQTPLPPAPAQEKTATASSKSIVDLAMESIGECVKAGDRNKLAAVRLRVIERGAEGKLQTAEIDKLEAALNDAEKAIKSGQAHAQWYDQQVKEAQKRSIEPPSHIQEIVDRF